MKTNRFFDKKFFKLTGIITSFGELVHIPRKGNYDLYKRVLTIQTEDNQILFPEIRNNKLRNLDRQMIQVNDRVEIEYSFEGSEKNGKRYNNIYINSIKKV